MVTIKKFTCNEIAYFFGFILAEKPVGIALLGHVPPEIEPIFNLLRRIESWDGAQDQTWEINTNFAQLVLSQFLIP